MANSRSCLPHLVLITFQSALSDSHLGPIHGQLDFRCHSHLRPHLSTNGAGAGKADFASGSTRAGASAGGFWAFGSALGWGPIALSQPRFSMCIDGFEMANALGAVLCQKGKLALLFLGCLKKGLEIECPIIPARGF